MAYEIMSNPAPMLESDMLESSMGRKTQGIIINQGSLNNLLECITQMLQQISIIQINPQELKKENRQHAMLLWELPLEVEQEFKAYLSTIISAHTHRPLSSINCNQLLEMVNDFPTQLFLHTFDKFYSRSALHVGILKGSQTLVHALLEKLKALSGAGLFFLS